MTADRIRGRALQAIRDRVLRDQPLCVQCQAQGRTTQATQVDHIVARVNGGTDSKYDDSNRQALCDSCHAAKTIADLGQVAKTGCDLTGWPTDPAHPWNAWDRAVEKLTRPAGETDCEPSNYR